MYMVSMGRIIAAGADAVTAVALPAGRPSASNRRGRDEDARRARPSMTLLLSVQDLTKSFGHRPLFAGLSLDLRACERVGLVGPNGAGKSTLLKLMAGCEEPDAGTRSVRRGARVGYVAQDDVFAPGETVRTVLLSALAEERAEEHERETRVATTLTQAGFTDVDQPADVLSGGWRKRLAL